MSDRIACLAFIPASLEPWGWADGILHPGSTLHELEAVAATCAWQSPLKISVANMNRLPFALIALQALWEREYSYEERNYTIREDARASPTDSSITGQPAQTQTGHQRAS
jgi:hypothetical protein